MVFPIVGTLLLGPTMAGAAPQTEPLARVEVTGPLMDMPFPVYAHLQNGAGQNYILTRATTDALTGSGYAFEIIEGAEPDTPLYLATSRRQVNAAAIPATVHILFDDGRNLLLLPGTATDHADLSRLGFQLQRLPATPMLLTAPAPTVLSPATMDLSANPMVSDMISHVQMTNLYTMMTELSGEVPVMAGGVFTNIVTRNTFETNALDRALDYAASHLEVLGLEVQYHPWSAYIHWLGRDVASRNIIAERRGSVTPSEIIILCAHIDSVPNGALAPGADDNASGTIGVLTAARAMQNYTFDRTVRYVIFTGEEQGLMGSMAYAAAAQAAGDTIVGVYNLDMISYDSNNDGALNLHTRATNHPGYASDVALAAIFTNVAGVYPLEHALAPVIYADSQGYSDHAPFWQNGYPAILAIEDWTHDVTPYYHTTNDVIETLNFPYFTAYVQATVAAAAHSAMPLGEISPAEKVSNAVHAVRVELASTLGNPVPSLSIYLQTSNDTYFASSAESPELALTTNTTFRFASNTKNFTATAVLLLHQMEWLNITNRIEDMIPGTAIPFIADGINWAIPFKDRITIQQLLNHSAGVYDVDNDPVPGLGGDSYTEWMMGQNPTHPFTVEEMVAQVVLHQLSYFEPGEGYHYSNTGYAMLAEIVGRVYSHYAGAPKTLSDFLYDMNVVGPDIRFPNLATDTALPEPFLPGTIYMPGGETVVISNFNMSAQVGEGNGYGTLPALNHHIRSTMRGEGVLDNERVRLMQATTSSANANYALGCEFRPGLGFGHNGARIGNLSFMAYNPDHDVSVVVYLPLWDFSDGMTTFMACFGSMYDAAYAALEALGYPPPPTLPEGTTTNVHLIASDTNAFYFSAAKDVYYGVTISGATADVQLALSPATDPASAQLFTNHFGWTSPASGTYRLDLTTAVDTAADIRLYTLTNTIAAATTIITNLLAERDAAAFSVALVDGEHVVWQEGFGWADRENSIPATAETIYNIGSVSKMFTAVAVMQLVDAGQLLLDEPLTNHLPGLLLQPRFPDASPMTTRQLLSHLSGLPAEFNNGMVRLWPVTSSDVTRVMAALPAEYPAMPPNFTPIYCNTGWTVAEALVEALSGMSFFDYAREHIFIPLGMTNSATLHDAFAMDMPLARPYRDGQLLAYEYLIASGAGGATSSAADLAQFLRMFLGQGAPNADAPRILQAASVREMFRSQATNTILGLTGNTQYPFFSPGLGFDGTHADQFAYLDDHTASDLGRFACKGGDTLTQHAFITLLPDAQLAIALNISGSGVPLFYEADLMLGHATLDKFGVQGPITPPAPAPAEVVPATSEQLLALEGAYSVGDGFTLIYADTENLTLTWIANAHTDEPDIHTGLVWRANGWFSAPATPEVELLFTNVVDLDFIVLRSPLLYYRAEKLYAQRYTLPPLSQTWSNRAGAYVIANLAPGEYEANALDYVPTYEISITNAIFKLVSKEDGTLLYIPHDEHTALLNFLGERSITSLQFDPEDDRFVDYGDFRLQRLDSLPLLSAPFGTNGIITADETILYRIPVEAGKAYTLDLVTTNTVQGNLNDDADVIGRINTARGIHIAPEADGEYVLAISRNGPNPGPWSLTLHTNTLPFYQPLEPADWPTDFAARSNFFPNTDFGYVFVPENHDSGTNLVPVLKIAVARMNASSPAAPALFFCNGGPEDSSIISVYQHYMRMFTNDYNVYLIDQRGINFSQPLLAAQDGESLAQTQYRLTLLEGADLSAINTTASSYDLDDIAAAFALTNVNLLGQSYGTLLAQTLMRRDPPWLRAVVLDGPVAPNIPAFEQGGLVMREALDALVRDVAASPTAATWYPELNEEFYALATRLEAQPYTLILPGWTNIIDGMTFIDAVTSQLTMGDLGTRERLPNIIWRAWRGEEAALAELYTGNHFDPDTMMPNVLGDLMGRLVIRHDFLPFTTLEGLTNAAAELREPLRTYAIAYDTAIINSGAELNDYGQAPPTFALPVTSAIPALVINGTYDTQTGTNWAVEVASHLPNSQLILVPTAGHGVLAGGACPQQIVRAFLADPLAPLDTTCLDTMQLNYPAPWPDAAPTIDLQQTVTSHYPSAQSGVWYVFAAQSNVIYDIAAGPVALMILDGQAQTQHQAIGPTSWLAPANGSVSLWLIADEPASHPLRLDIPLRMRSIVPAPTEFTLIWQSPDDTRPFVLEATEDLTSQPAFHPLVTNLTATGVFHQQTIPHDPARPLQFYRIEQPAE